MLSGKTVAVLLDQYYDEREFLYPSIRLQEAGAKVIVAGTKANTEYKGKTGYPSKSQVAYSDLNADELDGIVIPGGYAPDHMRRSAECVQLVRRLHEQKKMIALICHAGWLPISAGILKGVTATSVWAIRDDMVNAGVIWKDAPIVIDGHIISARHADDVAEFMKAVVAYLAS
jgi:protease I